MLNAKNLFISDIEGPLMYTSSSKIYFTGEVIMSNLSSREKATEIINFESSTSEIDSLVLNNLTSAIYSPIINFYSSTINIK